MKRTRHLSVEIEQRRLTFTLTRSEPAPPREPSPVEPGPAVCPECSSPWVAISVAMTVPAPETESASEGILVRALQQRGFHLHISPSGQLQICSRSLEKARFDETKESQ